MRILRFCYTPRNPDGGLVQDRNRVCKIIAVEDVVPPDVPFRPVPRWERGPRPEPWVVEIQKLGAIVQAISQLSEAMPMRQELQDVARKTLDVAVAELGDDVALTEHDLDLDAAS